MYRLWTLADLWLQPLQARMPPNLRPHRRLQKHPSKQRSDLAATR